MEVANTDLASATLPERLHIQQQDNFLDTMSLFYWQTTRKIGFNNSKDSASAQYSIYEGGICLI